MFKRFGLALLTLFAFSLLDSAQAFVFCDPAGNCASFESCPEDGDGDFVPVINAVEHIIRGQCPNQTVWFNNVTTYQVTLGVGGVITAVSPLSTYTGYLSQPVAKYLNGVFGAQDTNGDGNLNQGANKLGQYDTVDCDDTNPDISPRKTEIFNDNIDNDCNGLKDEHKFLSNHSLPTVGSSATTAYIAPIKIKINDDEQNFVLKGWRFNSLSGMWVPPVSGFKEPAPFKVELTYFSYNDVQNVQTITFDASAALGATYVDKELTFRAPNIFNSGEVYNIRVALKTSAGIPLGPVASAADDANQFHLVQAGRWRTITLGGTPVNGVIPTVTTFYGPEIFNQMFLIKAFSERLAFLRGEVGLAGTEPNGSKYGVGAEDSAWCDELPRWVGTQTSAEYNGGIMSDFWARQQTSKFAANFKDAADDKECFTNPGIDINGDGAVDSLDEKTSCSIANLTAGWVDTTDTDWADASWYDDGKGYYDGTPDSLFDTFYFVDLSPDVDTSVIEHASPGDILHHDEPTHFAIFIGWDRNVGAGDVYTLDGNMPTHAIAVNKKSLDGIQDFPGEPNRREYWVEVNKLSSVTY